MASTKDSCVSCVLDSTYHSVNVLVEGDANLCQSCTTCMNNVNYQSQTCLPAVNRVCPACTTSCPVGMYQQYPCNVTNNLGCKSCVSSCPVNSYLSSTICTGDTKTDVVDLGCIPCKTPLDCPGMYVSFQCLGSETVENQCMVCSVVPPGGECLYSQYRAGCEGYTNTHCIPFTVCGAGMYLSGESRVQDGVCVACTSCEALGLTVLQACRTYDDAVCKLGSCNSVTPCVTPVGLEARMRLYCDYTRGEMSAYCGLCPSGYDSNGQFCLECPRGKTCNRVGGVECQGQCGAGLESVCEVEFTGGYAWCETPCVQAIVADATKLVTRGTHVRPDTGRCDTYLQCAPGYYKVVRSTGIIDCVQCFKYGVFTSLMRWVTEGLSIGDRESCLWECKRELALKRPFRGECELQTGRSDAGSARNIEGWWGIPGSMQTCGYGKTSEAATTLVASECLACPIPPKDAEWVWNSQSCEWACVGQGTTRLGGACVSKRAVCEGVAGFVQVGGVAQGCVPTAFPWNQAGYYKLGWLAPVLGVGGGGVSPAGSGIFQDGVSVESLYYSIGGRHSISGPDFPSRYTQGPLCSATTAWVGGLKYMFGAVCNQSFLVYQNASIDALYSQYDYGLFVLIGRPSAPGWKDGFRTVAQFESELYVTSASGMDGTLYVLDRWNCLLREVTIFGEPGGYLTRVDTMYGLTNKFDMVGQAKCYGEGSLAWPRRFWALQDGWVAFADEDGLWQFHTVTRELVVMVKESALEGGFEADALLDVDATDVYTVRLVFAGGVVWTISAEQARCPEGFTSMAGGDCKVECRHLDSTGKAVHWTSQLTGLCMACTVPVCGLGEEMVGCAVGVDAYCRQCDYVIDPVCQAELGDATCVQCEAAATTMGGAGVYTDVANFVVLRFTASGTVRFSADDHVDILVIGGGGNGGTNVGGAGGGAGTVIFAESVLIPKDVTISVTVGGAGQASSMGTDFIASQGGNGGKSSGLVGGTGGGVGGTSTVFGVAGIYTSANAYANSGASGGRGSYYFGGAGGGAGGVGSYGQCAAGGVGLSRVTISGKTSVFSDVFGQAFTSVAVNGAVAGGGTGSKCCDDGACGSDGLGGNGVSRNYNAGEGRSNTGSGGGGAYLGSAGAGGAGLVLIKRPGKYWSQAGQVVQTLKCTANSNLVYSKAGTCEANTLRPIPPCVAGSYVVVNAVVRYCEECPEFTSTWRANATRVEQCKCGEGLMRRASDGACVGEALFSGWEQACVSGGGCGVPPYNASFVSPSCDWACDTGFYHDTLAGWSDKCVACLGSGGLATTRGDADSPWSCEGV